MLECRVDEMNNMDQPLTAILQFASLPPAEPTKKHTLTPAIHFLALAKSTDAAYRLVNVWHVYCSLASATA